MDLIPVIVNVFIYILAALIIVLFVSYTFSSLMQNKTEKDEEILIERRKNIRRYIVNQNQYITSSSSNRSRKLSPHYYTAPTYSRSVYPVQTKENQRLRKTNGKLSQKTPTKNTTTEQNKRYSIVNEIIDRKNNKTHWETTAKAYTSLKEQHYYQY